MIPRGIVGKLSIAIDINNSTKQLDDLLVRSKIIVAEGPGKRLDIEAEVDADQDVFLSKYVGKVISVKSGDHTIFCWEAGQLQCEAKFNCSVHSGRRAECSPDCAIGRMAELGAGGGRQITQNLTAPVCYSEIETAHS